MKELSYQSEAKQRTEEREERKQGTLEKKTIVTSSLLWVDFAEQKTLGNLDEIPALLSVIIHLRTGKRKQRKKRFTKKQS